MLVFGSAFPGVAKGEWGVFIYLFICFVLVHLRAFGVKGWVRCNAFFKVLIILTV